MSPSGSRFLPWKVTGRAFAFGGAVLLLLGLEEPGPRERPRRGPEPLSAAAVPAVALEPIVPRGVTTSITFVSHAGDERLFLTLQRGQIVILEGGSVLPTSFLDLGTLITCCGERGLLSTVFHPNYRENGLFFIDYTNDMGDTVIARYRVREDDPNRADPSSGVTLLTIDQPFENHNGGQLAFGPDGYLYIGMGDGGAANDPFCNAQRDDTLLGKILRIDVDQEPGAPPYFGIPPSNPFAGAGDPADKFWAKGLRNPWRFSFDRLTGDLYIGDVGQGTIEEIDLQPAGSPGGENYGWKLMEGAGCGTGGNAGCPSEAPACNSPSFVNPILQYFHGSGDCSVTGGFVYRGGRIPNLYGAYVYGDYCSGRIWAGRRSEDRWTEELLPPRIGSLTTFGQGLDGELYVGTENGELFRLVTTETFVPTVASAAPSSGPTRGGTLLTIQGSNFVTGATVEVGGVAAPFSVASPSTLLVTTPPHAPGTVDILITNPGAPGARLAAAFTYVPLVEESRPRPTPRVVSPRE